MSTRKNVEKSIGSKKVSSTSRINARTREESVDRKKKEKVEIPIKKDATDTRNTKVERTVSEIKSKVPKSSSRTSVDSKVATSKKKIAPDGPSKTPSTSKITKTQFFPSKNMYSHALKDKVERVTKATSDINEKPEKPSKDSGPSGATRSTRQTKSLVNVSSKSRVEKTTPKRSMVELKKTGAAKISGSKHQTQPPSLESNESPDTSTTFDRPRTATLRKGSIVNANIVGPNAPKTVTKSEVPSKAESPQPESEEEIDYEEDFDSYESDFEQYSSSSSNIENFSGEETSSSTDERVAPRVLQSAQKKALSASSDEDRKLDSGHFDMPDYKHKHILDNIKESVERENTNLVLNNPASLSDEGFEEQKSLQMINFLDAQKKYEHRKSVEIKRKRGEDILSMIRLDTYSFTLFDLPSVPYDVFIKNYGRSNCVQVAVQTGDDDSEESTQTEDIDVTTKWTQAPVTFSSTNEDDPQFWRIYKYDYLGVGSETCEKPPEVTKSYSERAFNNFFSSAGNLVLRILEETTSGGTNELERNSRAIPFSDGYFPLDTSEDIFKGSSVTCVNFSCDTRGRIMTVHSRISDGDSVLAVWRICDPKQPEAIFLSHGVTCCSFGQENLGLVFAGFDSGSLCVWRMNRRNKKLSDKSSPDFCTDIGHGHESRVVGLNSIGDHIESNFNETSQTNEICSLDENGDVLLWTVIMKNSKTDSSVLLVLNSRVSLQDTHPDLGSLQCTDIAIDPRNTNIALISTNYGYIIHHLIKGGRSNVKTFIPDSRSVANCLELCPFSTNHFLAGHQNGDINLYSRFVEKPLMVFADKECSIHQCGVELIEWSRTKPFVVYAKDKSNTIHIWDLSESDMRPIYSVPIGINITCMKLSTTSNIEMESNSYLAIGTEDGLVFIHQLSEEHSRQPKKFFDEQVKLFSNYVSRL